MVVNLMILYCYIAWTVSRLRGWGWRYGQEGATFFVIAVKRMGVAFFLKSSECRFSWAYLLSRD